MREEIDDSFLEFLAAEDALCRGIINVLSARHTGDRSIQQNPAAFNCASQ